MRLNISIKILLLAFLIFLPATAAWAASVTLRWNSNSEADISGYNIYYGTASRNYGLPIPVGRATTTYTLENLTEGTTYYFALTAIDTAGNESGYSSEVIANVTSPEPITIPVLVPNIDWKISGANDFNGDGSPDILWRHNRTGKNGVWYMNGADRIGTESLPDVPNVDWKMGGTSDFNGDGNPDILWRHNTTGKNSVWYMNGANRIGTESLPDVPNVDWKMGGTSDFNGDGHPDILWRHNTTGKIGVWYMNGANRIGTEYFFVSDDN